MTSIDDLSTPCVLVDLDVVERNIERMQRRAREAGVRLRPHAKTHKSPEIGRMQIGAGAAGLTLAKTSEAEVFAAAGFEDVFLAYPIVGKDKARRLLALSDRMRVSVGVDSVEGARSLGDAFKSAGRSLPVLLKIDAGAHRVGVDPPHALDCARRIVDLPGLKLRGIFTHAGQAYGAQRTEEVDRIARDEGTIMAETAEAIRSAGLPVEVVSVGSTPTARVAMGVAGVTECRPGTYVFEDLSQVTLGVCDLEDGALTVRATVVSAPASGRAVVDAGSKTLSSDPLRPKPNGHGLVLGRRSRIERLSEEHGVLRVEPDETFRVGDTVRVVPNHACAVVNLHDRLIGIRGDRVEGEIRVAARGAVQ